MRRLLLLFLRILLLFLRNFFFSRIKLFLYCIYIVHRIEFCTIVYQDSQESRGIKPHAIPKDGSAVRNKLDRNVPAIRHPRNRGDNTCRLTRRTGGNRAKISRRLLAGTGERESPDLQNVPPPHPGQRRRPINATVPRQLVYYSNLIATQRRLFGPFSDKSANYRRLPIIYIFFISRYSRAFAARDNKQTELSLKRKKLKIKRPVEARL